MDYLNNVKAKDIKNSIGFDTIYHSKNSGDFKIVKYNHAKDVEIQFVSTGFETTVQLGDIRNGEVKDRYLPSVYAIGIIGAKYPVSEGGRDTKEYKAIVTGKQIGRAHV